ncbi:hypothetical protein [Streptomyces sp. NPDC048650]|uniref:hypothetical protein n=1 Tax=Streptomyces sp. NPDC048650 TaxID=3365583 RepID=UPI003722E2E8
MMRGVGRLVQTDRPFDMTCITVVTVTDGLITHYRDYWLPPSCTTQRVTSRGATWRRSTKP